MERPSVLRSLVFGGSGDDDVGKHGGARGRKSKSAAKREQRQRQQQQQHTSPDRFTTTAQRSSLERLHPQRWRDAADARSASRAIKTRADELARATSTRRAKDIERVVRAFTIELTRLDAAEEDVLHKTLARSVSSGGETAGSEVLRAVREDAVNAARTRRVPFVAPVPVRPRSRGERRSLRTSTRTFSPGVCRASPRPPLAFDARPARRLSTPTDAPLNF